MDYEYAKLMMNFINSLETSKFIDSCKLTVNDVGYAIKLKLLKDNLTCNIDVTYIDYKTLESNKKWEYKLYMNFYKKNICIQKVSAVYNDIMQENEYVKDFYDLLINKNNKIVDCILESNKQEIFDTFNV